MGCRSYGYGPLLVRGAGRFPGGRMMGASGSARRPGTWPVGLALVRPRLAVASLLASIVVVTAPTPAYAACEGQVDQVAAIEAADSVFVGRVVEVADFGRRATFEVIEIWKGPELPTQVVVNGSFSGSEQIGPKDRTFTNGSTYAVVPFGTRSPFFDEVCSGTHLYNPTGAIPLRFQEAVGASVPRVPAAPFPGGGESGPWSRGYVPIVIGSAGVGLVLVLMAIRGRRRRRARKSAAEQPRIPAEPIAERREGRQRIRATAAVASVAGRKRTKSRRRLRPVRSFFGFFRKLRPTRSGLSNLEMVRRKSRKVKRKRKAKAK